MVGGVHDGIGDIGVAGPVARIQDHQGHDWILPGYAGHTEGVVADGGGGSGRLGPMAQHIVGIRGTGQKAPSWYQLGREVRMRGIHARVNHGDRNARGPGSHVPGAGSLYGEQMPLLRIGGIVGNNQRHCHVIRLDKGKLAARFQILDHLVAGGRIHR